MKTKLTKIIVTLISAFLFFLILINGDKPLVEEPKEIVFYFEQNSFLKDMTKIEMIYSDDYDCYYLFTPANVDLRKTYVETNGNIFWIEDKNIHEIDKVSLENNKKYTIKINGEISTLFVYQGSCENIMYINTENGDLELIHEDKDYSEAAEMVLLKDGIVNYAGDLEYIKGRGNSTWEYYSKKPYNIKLDEKTKLLGMPSDRDWCLLANYVDNSLLKNKFLYDLASDYGVSYSPQIEPIDLYINGEYLGAYTLVQKIKTGASSVDIFDLGKHNYILNKDLDFETLQPQGDYDEELTYGTMKWFDLENESSIYDGGYIIETDLQSRYATEKSGFVTTRGVPNVLKEPEYATYNEIKFISEYYQRFEDALYGDSGFNEYGGYYTDYIDMDSFVKMFVLQEFSKNLDTGVTSSYLVKDVNIKFVVGPVWDLDNALKTSYYRGGIDYLDPNGFAAALSFIHHNYNPTIFSAAYQHLDFRNDVFDEYNYHFRMIIDEHCEKLDNLALELLDSSIMNHILWDTYKTNDYDTVKYDYYNGEVKEVLEFIEARLEFLDANMSKENCNIVYKGNNADSYMLNPTQYKPNEVAKIKECSYKKDGQVFDSWNTKPDGTGTTYLPEDEIIIEDNLILYAIWK